MIWKEMKKIYKEIYKEFRKEGKVDKEKWIGKVKEIAKSLEDLGEIEIKFYDKYPYIRVVSKDFVLEVRDFLLLECFGWRARIDEYSIEAWIFEEKNDKEKFLEILNKILKRFNLKSLEEIKDKIKEMEKGFIFVGKLFK